MLSVSLEVSEWERKRRGGREGGGMLSVSLEVSEWERKRRGGREGGGMLSVSLEVSEWERKRRGGGSGRERGGEGGREGGRGNVKCVSGGERVGEKEKRREGGREIVKYASVLKNLLSPAVLPVTNRDTSRGTPGKTSEI